MNANRLHIVVKCQDFAAGWFEQAQIELKAGSVVGWTMAMRNAAKYAAEARKLMGIE